MTTYSLYYFFFVCWLCYKSCRLILIITTFMYHSRTMILMKIRTTFLPFNKLIFFSYLLERATKKKKLKPKCKKRMNCIDFLPIGRDIQRKWIMRKQLLFLMIKSDKPIRGADNSLGVVFFSFEENNIVNISKSYLKLLKILK